MKNKITREEYMNNSNELHHAFYSQFITEETNRFILSSLKIEEIKKAMSNEDEHLNKIKIPYNNMHRGGGWWWDDAPINLSLLKQLGGSDTQSTRTSIAKAAARKLTGV